MYIYFVLTRWYDINIVTLPFAQRSTYEWFIAFLQFCIPFSSNELVELRPCAVCKNTHCSSKLTTVLVINHYFYSQLSVRLGYKMLSPLHIIIWSSPNVITHY